MLRRIFRFFTVVDYPYANPVQQQQARSLLFFISTMVLLILGVLYLFIALNLVKPANITLIVVVVAPFVFLAMVWLIKTGRFVLATFIFLTIISLGVFGNVAAGIRNLAVITLLLPVIVATLFTSQRVMLFVGALTIITLFLGYYTVNEVRIVLPSADRLPNFLSNTVAVSFIISLLYLFGSNLQSLIASYSSTANDLRRAMNAPELNELQLSENEILTLALQNLRNGFGYSFGQIYLLDDARRTAQSFYIGFSAETLHQGDHLDINTANAVGECLRTNTAIKVNNNSTETRKRHLSAGMRVGVLIPIQYEGKAIGVIDLQSDKNQDLTDNQLEVFQLYSIGLASALVRARLLSQLREDVREQESIIVKQRQRLRDFEQSEHSIMPSTTWETYFQQNINGLVGFNVDGKTTKMIASDDLSLTMRESLEKGELVVMTEDNQQVASLPIFLRDQLLGAMSFKLPREVVLTERQRELLNSVVQRLALALENKRLFEQSQAQATRESKANEVAGLLLSTTDINTVLQLAAESFNEALGAIRTEVYLQQNIEGELR